MEKTNRVGLLNTSTLNMTKSVWVSNSENDKIPNHQKLCLWPRQTGKLAWGLFCTGFSFIAMVIWMIQILFLFRYAVPIVPAEKCQTQQLKNIQVSTGSHAKMFIFYFWNSLLQGHRGDCRGVLRKKRSTKAKLLGCGRKKVKLIHIVFFVAPGIL